MSQTPEVLVIGAGVIGASVAFHLARRGAHGVVVVDRSQQPCEGSTGRATGGFRAQYASEVNVRLSLLSRAKLARFSDETGVDPGYRPVGYLFVTHREATLELLLDAQRIQHRCGLTEARPVSPREIASLNPLIDDAQIAGGVYCPTDGFIRPTEIARGYREAAQRLGARFYFGEGVQRIERDGRRIRTVETSRATYSPSVIVNAAGPWAADVSRLAGVELPVTRLKRQVAATAPTTALPEEMPMTIWVDDGFHLRVRDGRVLLLRPAPPASDSLEVEEEWLQETVRLAHARFPLLRDAPIDRGGSWAGYYEMSPDRHAIVGLDELENFYFVNGSSGHGVMHSPALGQLVAEMVGGDEPAIDVASLRPSRFREGAAIESLELL